MFGLRGNSKRRPLLLGVGALALSFIPASSLLAEVTKSGVVESLLSWADFKQSKDLKKTDGTKKNKITGVPKLDDANDAGVVQSHKCTLILTEGDSAKALVMAGLSVVGRNYYGVFPLRGKLLNVWETIACDIPIAEKKSSNEQVTTNGRSITNSKTDA